MIDTKTRILDAAEKLFAEKGYSATSLRQIMSLAKVNVAAVHYHFRAKESLLEAVLRRRADQINRERLEMLEGFERKSPAGMATLEQTLEAFLLPTFRLASDPERGGHTYVRLLGRLLAESDLLPGNVLANFAPVLLRFGEALQRALPHLPAADVYWRSRLAMGATAQVLRDQTPAITTKHAPGSEAAWERSLRRLVVYLSAGFRAQSGDSRMMEDIQNEVAASGH
jgi:AcrR family transcriptional regulator